MIASGREIFVRILNDCVHFMCAVPQAPFANDRTTFGRGGQIVGPTCETHDTV